MAEPDSCFRGAVRVLYQGGRGVVVSGRGDARRR